MALLSFEWLVVLPVMLVWCHKLTTLFLLHPAVWLMLSELSVSSPWVVVLSKKFDALITLGRL